MDLPLNGRNWASLAQLAAGVTTASTQFSGAPGSAYFAVDGINPWQTDFRLDGIDDNVEIYGGPGPTNTNVNITPPPDAIEEFRLQNGDFNAEFGHSTAGIVNAVIRSGTNRVRGDIWSSCGTMCLTRTIISQTRMVSPGRSTARTSSVVRSAVLL